MPRPQRAEQFVASEVCIVHVVQRCVRKAWLAGVDPASGKDYSFRREWIRRRLEMLASTFAIDVLSYAVLSSHMHQILRNRPDVVATWTDEEVAIRWLRVFPGRRLEEHLAEPTENDVKMLVQNPERLAEIRRRLADISWFMRALAEPIARMANKQDKCTGRFWEGRFKAQRIVDEAGLLACSMYVDLNPVRAAMAESPEEYEHTSAYDRAATQQGAEIPAAAFDLQPVASEQAAESMRTTPVDQLRDQRQQQRRNPTGRQVPRDSWLSPLRLEPNQLSGEAQPHTEGLRSSDRGFLPLSWQEYWELLRWTARASLGSAAKAFPQQLTGRLAVLGIDAGMWRDLVWDWPKYFGRSSRIGRPESLKQHAKQTGRHHYHGQASSSVCFA